MKKFLLPALLVFSLPLFGQNNAEYRVAAIGFYNLENLFDTINDPKINDEDFQPTGKYLWTAQKYNAKQGNMAKVISALGTEISPDGLAILGVSEIENRRVLDDLVQQPALRERHYSVVHFDSPDERGIDCGLLYQPKYFQVTSAKPLYVNLITPVERDTDFTRDVLYVTGLFDGEPLHIMVCHWPSRSGGEKASAWARAAAAAVCRQNADSILLADPGAKILVMGDLNDDPNNKSLTQVLQARYEPEGLKDKELFNTMASHFKAGNGSLAYRDSWNLFDQIIISQPMVDKNGPGYQFYKSVVFRQPWMLQQDGNYQGYPMRTFSGDNFINGYSDHLPVYILMLKKV